MVYAHGFVRSKIRFSMHLWAEAAARRFNERSVCGRYLGIKTCAYPAGCLPQGGTCRCSTTWCGAALDCRRRHKVSGDTHDRGHVTERAASRLQSAPPNAVARRFNPGLVRRAVRLGSGPAIRSENLPPGIPAVGTSLWVDHPKTSTHQALNEQLVPRKGLEPSRPFGHWHLKPARLPIPPPGHATRARA